MVANPESLFEQSFSISVRIDYLDCTDLTATLGIHLYNICMYFSPFKLVVLRLANKLMQCQSIQFQTQ